MDKKEIKNTDTFTLGGKEFTSRFILGSGKFSLDLVKACVEKAGAQIITLALRRQKFFYTFNPVPTDRLCKCPSRLFSKLSAQIFFRHM